MYNIYVYYRCDDDEIPDEDDFDELVIDEEIEEAPIQIKYRQVLKHIPDVPYVPIACSDGSRVYLRIFPEKPIESTTTTTTNNNNTNKSTKSLLAVGFHELKKQAEVSVNKSSVFISRM